jgi:UDP-GlcNAc:undecaprenyl-phosphate GlcNAc-1-phosphate transferase
MDSYILAITSFICCALAVPLVRKIAVKWRIYDPVGPLKIHTTAIPRIGGIAMIIGLFLGMLLQRELGWENLCQFGIPLVALWLIGLIDDLRELSPSFRLVVQLVAATLPWIFGQRSTWTGVMAVDALIQVLVIATFINAFNFLDGADGIAAGVSAIIAAGYILVSGSSVAWGLLGISLAFLLFNFPPANIFMGDSGSTILGFVVAFVGLDFYRFSSVESRAVVPLMFAALPLLDMAFAIVRRVRSGVSIAQGDRRHCFDLLLRRGWSPRVVALSCYAVTGLLVIIGYTCRARSFTFTIYIFALVVGLGALTGFGLGSLSGERRVPPAQSLSSSAALLTTDTDTFVNPPSQSSRW